jgi:hypothetical protein
VNNAPVRLPLGRQAVTIAAMSPRSRNVAIAVGVVVLILAVAVAMRGRDTNTTASTAPSGSTLPSTAPAGAGAANGSTTSTTLGASDGTVTTSPTPPPSDAASAPTTSAVPASTVPPVTEPRVRATPTTAPMPLAVNVSPASGLGNGSDVTIHVAPTGGSKIFGFEARLCKAGVDYTSEADFDPTISGKCASKPLSATSQEYKEVPAKPPFEVLDATFKVGVGSDSFKTEQGTPTTVTCGPGNPCVVVLKLQFPDGFAFRSYPVSFG